jgi:hypothetical protein
MRAIPILLALVLSLAACEWTLPPLPGTGLRQIKLFDKTLTVAAPRGYCIDPATSVERGETVVLLIGPCARGGQVAAAVVSLTIGAPGSAGVLAAGPDVLAKFFTGPAGRKLLARDGVAAHVKIERVMVGEGALYLLLQDRAAGEYWRAFSAIRGRLVTISASGALGAPLTAEQGFDLVLELQKTLIARNPDAAPPAKPAPR